MYIVIELHSSAIDPIPASWYTVRMKPVYFIQEVNPLWPPEGEELGPITFRQEIFCWMYAITGNGMKAMRHAYDHKTVGARNTYQYRLRRRPAIQERIRQIKEADASGLPNIFHPAQKVIKLAEGPWQHYGKFDEGFPIDRGGGINAVREFAWREDGRIR